MQIHFSRGVCGEKTENNCLPFCESILTSVHGSHIIIVEANGPILFSEIDFCITPCLYICIY